MKYPALRLSPGRIILSNLRGNEQMGKPQVVPEFREVQTSNTVEVGTILDELKRVISVDEAGRLLSKGMSRDSVEGALALQLHLSVQSLPARALADPDFWRFIAIEVLRGFVLWRDGADCSLASFGLTSVRRIPDCVPLRMFNRAHIARAIEANGGPNADAVVVAGGADFWQSHILRVQNRYDWRIVEGLIASMEIGSIPNVGVLREVAKDIKQLRSNRMLELLPANKIIDVLGSIEVLR